MRLKENDVLLILKGLNEIEFLKDNFDLFLFGSRTSNEKKGGDIDLLMVVPEKLYNQVVLQKHLLLSQSKKYIEEQKIDFTIRSRESLNSDPFFSTIKDQLINLYSCK